MRGEGLGVRRISAKASDETVPLRSKKKETRLGKMECETPVRT